MVKRKRQYCYGCEKVHTYDAHGWHEREGEDFVFCHAHYMEAYRSKLVKAGEPDHPTWLRWMSELDAIDDTGHAIVACNFRPDVRGLIAMASLCRASHLWTGLEDIFFLGALWLQMYWPWPMQDFWHGVRELAPSSIAKSLVVKLWQGIEKQYSNMKVVQGVLVHGAKKGLSLFRNPSERRPGRNRFMKLAGELKNWRRCAEAVASLFTSRRRVALSDILNAFGEWNLQTFSSTGTYKNIRIARALALMAGVPLADTERDWRLWRGMSAHVRQVCRDSGIWSYAEACRFRDALRSRTGIAEYGFNDLICFACLQQDNFALEDDDD